MFKKSCEEATFFPAPLITIKTTIIITIIMFLGNQHHRHLREALEEVELFPWPTPWRPCRDRRARRRGGSATLEVEDIHGCYLKCYNWKQYIQLNLWVAPWTSWISWNHGLRRFIGLTILSWIGNMNYLLKHTAFKTQISFSEVLGLDWT